MPLSQPHLRLRGAHANLQMVQFAAASTQDLAFRAASFSNATLAKAFLEKMPHAANQIHSCVPICSWKCSKPSCEEVCEPVCEAPRCDVRCPKTPDASSC